MAVPGLARRASPGLQPGSVAPLPFSLVPEPLQAFAPHQPCAVVAAPLWPVAAAAPAPVAFELAESEPGSSAQPARRPAAPLLAAWPAAVDSVPLAFALRLPPPAAGRSLVALAFGPPADAAAGWAARRPSPAGYPGRLSLAFGRLAGSGLPPDSGPQLAADSRRSLADLEPAPPVVVPLPDSCQPVFGPPGEAGVDWTGR